MFGLKKKKPQFNNYMEESAFTAGLQYNKLMDELTKLDAEITADIVHGENLKIVSAADIFKKEK